MSKVSITRSKLDTLANTISTKSGASLPLTLDQMDAAVRSISGGGTVEPLSVTANGTYTAPSGTAYSPVTVDVPTPAPSLQSKTATPTEQQQTVAPDSGYDGLSSVTVDAIPSTYVGSGITQRTSSDLTASGATVTVPAGHYAAQASKAVASGTEGTPTATKGSVSNHAVTVTPSVTNSAGYIAGGTHGGTGVTVAASELVGGTKAITGAGTTDVTEYASASVASGGATPSATKGAVSNHSVTVTPKVTRTAGWVSAGSSNGTAVTVSASELVSGSQTITDNGTVDVTNLASVTVNVPTGGASQTVYSGTSAPTASVGNDGDLYLVLSGSGSATGYPLEYTSSGMSGTSNAGDCIGKSAEDGTSTANMYSSGSGSSGSVDYTFDLPSIPADATITGVTCQVKAHEENASRSEMTLQLRAGGTGKGSATTVSGTSNTIYNLDTGSWTRAEIDSLVLHSTYGYYGGLVAGATLTVSYSCEAQNECRLTVKDGSWALTGDIWQKSGGAWSQVSSVALEDIIGRA